MQALLNALPSKEKIAKLAVLFSLTILLFPNVGAAAQAKTVQEKSLNFEIKSQLNQIQTKPLLATVNTIEPANLQTVKLLEADDSEIANPDANDSDSQNAEKSRIKSVDGKVFWTEQQIADYACPMFGKDCKTFIAILKAENGTHECTRRSIKANKNGSYDWGLAQINDKATPGYTREQLQDCKINLDIAYKKYTARGNSFGAWTAYKTGAYKKNLPYINI